MGSVGFSGNSDSNHMKHTSTEGKETIMKAKLKKYVIPKAQFV